MLSTKKLKTLLVEKLRSNISQLVLRRDVVDADDAVVHEFSYVEKAKSNMLGP